MYYRKVPDDFSICAFGYENRYSDNGIYIGRVLEELHKTYHFSFKSMKEKILKEVYDDHCEKWYASRTSFIFLTARERKILPMHNGSYISHYFKR